MEAVRLNKTVVKESIRRYSPTLYREDAASIERQHPPL